MSNTRSYRQSCSLALALDLIGERWTILIIRELLLGPRRFSDLLPNLQGMGTNLLSTRLKDLEANGLIEKLPSSPNSKRRPYQLTESGRALENVLRELMRWSASLPQKPRNPDYLYQPEWDLIALRLLYQSAKAPELEGTVRICSDGHTLFATATPQGLQLKVSEDAKHEASIYGDRDSLERLFKGKESLNKLLAEKSIKITGSIAFVRKWASCFR